MKVTKQKKQNVALVDLVAYGFAETGIFAIVLTLSVVPKKTWYAYRTHLPPFQGLPQRLFHTENQDIRCDSIDAA